MNNLKSIITIIAICFATSFASFASETTPTKVNNKLRTEIVSIIGNNIKVEIEKTTKAEISFLVNEENEIVVVSVYCNSNEFNSYIKSKLNYKKIDAKGVKKGEIYIIPVTINKK